MALMLFDFQCSCGNLFEELVGSHEQTAPCPECKADGVRQIAAPRIDWLHMGTDPGFPGAYDKWARAKTVHHKTDPGSMHNGKAANLKMY